MIYNKLIADWAVLKHPVSLAAATAAADTEGGQNQNPKLFFCFFFFSYLNYPFTVAKIVELENKAENKVGKD